MCKNVDDDADVVMAQQIGSATAVLLHDEPHLQLAFSGKEGEYAPTDDMSVGSGESYSG